MKKFGTVMISAVVLLGLLAACGNMPLLSRQEVKPVEHKQPDRPPIDAAYKERIKLYRERTERFVLSKLYGPDGVYTNYLDSSETDTAASGHEVLSESAGLMMRYYVLMNRQEDFQAEWERAKRVFELPSGFSYRYSPKRDEKYTLNAAVDDLRIIRALYEAGTGLHRNIPNSLTLTESCSTALILKGTNCTIFTMRNIRSITIL
ncbi:hypothetical protein RE628_03955 [Paenibacillus sp. D2_2]|uniref:hypothetical protein n=1 Tax=Paenibacillus sp. D2_2 TaxID=3073092 RepID=UPI002814C8C9|nr:hypothetical protein [Paenibacillus sp. D2_2]WMT41665.1 hypothetical protein RE628_03955 [Paenibacillus sp. D2_2]